MRDPRRYGTPSAAVKYPVSALRSKIRRMRALAWVLLAASVLGCPVGRVHCAPGYTPVCQSGAMHGTRCVCEPPPRYRDEH